MEKEKKMRILREAGYHASVLVAYMEQGGEFPLPEPDMVVSALDRERSAIGFFLKKAEIWQMSGGKANGILTPIFKRATRPRREAAFSSGTPLPSFGGTMRIVLTGEGGCAASGDRALKVRNFFKRVVELTDEELKKMEG